MNISNPFQVFMTEAPDQAKVWMNAAKALDDASALDKKTEELAYIAVLAAVRLTSGMPFHVQLAKKFGASRKEVISAVLLGLPATGNVVIQSLPVALEA
ncbi:carboxymuconolactone decarboxylase family protein [Azotobacter chroococcum]|uniref:Carboxymuconolactone decarboxylase family protein n=1 Tax=Azotobacter chroococcum TaxID=353 RepID=A0AAQ0C132_9GAMM|nr:carboxymuconolactone decarboxylase family protein [Azotobacter chroococcum]QQE91152.1 carboxymuconolactone decarboxylase family protein [Azotobacter chroococcum]TKD33161.1 carboxymuconolactone decarboxylase family protein [Azotobacter chroococcum]